MSDFAGQGVFSKRNMRKCGGCMTQVLLQSFDNCLAAGDIVGLIYDAFHKQYAEPDSEETLKNLNKLSKSSKSTKM